MKPLHFIAFAIALILGFAGCAGPSTSVALPRAPAWVRPVAAKPSFTAAEVAAAVRAVAPLARVDTSDVAFTVVDHAWLVRMVHWSDRLLQLTGQRYTAESFDCDKFAKAFTLGVEWSAGRAGVKAQPLVARLFVLQERGFAGVGAGGAHALVGFASTEGLFVLEPQPGAATGLRLVPLERYPNRAQIFLVRLGG